MISTFVIRYLESLEVKLALYKIPLFKLVSVAWKIVSSLTLSATGRQVLSRLGHYSQTLLITAHADVLSQGRCLMYGLRLYIYTFFVYASVEGSDDSAHMRSLNSAIVAHLSISTKTLCLSQYRPDMRKPVFWLFDKVIHTSLFSNRD